MDERCNNGLCDLARGHAGPCRQPHAIDRLAEMLAPRAVGVDVGALVDREASVLDAETREALTKRIHSVLSTRPSGLVVGVRGSGHVIVADRVPYAETPASRARLTPAEARDLASEILRAADHIEAEQDRRNAEQAPQFRLECDEQRELAV